MTRRVEWSETAADEFDQAIDHIALESQTNALLVSSRILDSVDLLAEFPTGRQGRVAGTYEKPIRNTPYIVAYRLSEDMIFILRVIHGSRDWPEGDWPAE